MREQLAKGLPAGDIPTKGNEDNSWARIAELMENKNWRQECLRRDEKFEMHFSSAVCSTIILSSCD